MAQRKTKSTAKTTGKSTKKTAVKKTKTASKRVNKTLAEKSEKMIKNELRSDNKPNTYKIEFPREYVKFGAIGLVVIIALIGFSLSDWLIVGSVNGSPITRIELYRTMEDLSGQQTLQNMVTEKLIMQEARNQNVAVTQAEIDQQIATLESNLTDSGQSLDQALAMQGQSRAGLERQIRIQTLIEKLLEGQVEISDEDIQEYLDEDLVMAPEDASEEERADLAREQLQQDRQQQFFQTWIAGLREQAEISTSL